MVETGLRRLNGYGVLTLLCVGLGLVTGAVGGDAYRPAAIFLLALAGVTVGVAMARNGDDDEGYPADGDDESRSDGEQRRRREMEGEKGRAMGESL